MNKDNYDSHFNETVFKDIIAMLELPVYLYIYSNKHYYIVDYWWNEINIRWIL